MDIHSDVISITECRFLSVKFKFLQLENTSNAIGVKL